MDSSGASRFRSFLFNYFWFDDFIWLYRAKSLGQNWKQMFFPEVMYFELSASRLMLLHPENEGYRLELEDAAIKLRRGVEAAM